MTNTDTRYNSLNIECDKDLIIDLHIHQNQNNDEHLQIQIHDKLYRDIIYDEIVVDNSTKIRDFFIKAYPLTPKEVFDAGAIVFKSIVIRKFL